MPARTGAEYSAALQENQPEVYGSGLFYNKRSEG